ncbi:extended synaptotagmin-1 isoform X2 [Iris pallida]|uniref:Extended synaptotagmin-1 isoform X2 n=1 Tax=Iris pallida TaxID=29817 RepID=A0AAX6FV83_IRIPA|nr:extended synaptotagmin-1 isoform X2 [Iris pallida]KAJ6819881.1 extended synaptotagmin-1 isoform X2 [Iris pallida]
MMVMKKKLGRFSAKEAKDFISHVIEDKPLLPFLLPLLLFAWAIERWLVPFSNWVPLVFAVWATIEYGRCQRQVLVEDLNMRWKQLILNTTPITPFEPCEWLNKLTMEVWPNFLEPKISRRFFSVVERRLKSRRPTLIEKLELQEFSLGSCPPNLGRHGMHWITSGDQKVLRLGFDWDTNEMSVMLMAKLAKPLRGTARIVINQIHIKGDLLLTPILDGQAILYSFESTPDIRIGVAFGSGGSQTLPATELPGVSSWLVKLLTETLGKTMVEPRRGCYSLPSVDLGKSAVGCVLSVSVVSASNFGGKNLKANSLGSRLSSTRNSQSSGSFGNQVLQTFIEVELGDLTRRTNFGQGLNPRWDATFNMILHGITGIVKFHLYERESSSVKFNYLTSCEIKLRYVADGSTTFWAIARGSGVVAKQAEYCGKTVEMVVPFEDTNYGELAVSLVLKEWQFSDGSISLRNSVTSQSQPSIYGSPSLQLRTGRKLIITVMEGKYMVSKSGKCDPYVKLQYGKAAHRTKTILHTSNPVWNQMFELEEIGGGEYLKIKCYTVETLRDENIGSAQVSLEGIQEGTCRDVWIPLERVSSGELRLQIEAVKSDDHEGYRNSLPRSGTVELVLIEARDLIAADLRGTSDPFVIVQYGNTKKRTKVIHKTLNPQWNQTLEFPDTGDHLVLHVKDHNDLLPMVSIGDCVVEYERLPPNQTAEKWIPLQGVTSGEIHVLVTRRVPELEKVSSMATYMSSPSKAQKMSGQMRETLKKFHGLVEDGNLEGLSVALSEVETAEDAQKEYMLQLEREKTSLINKITQLGHEISRTTSIPGHIPY